MESFIRKHYLRIIFIVLGAVGGFMYWKFIGCESGTCKIKSVWYWSTLYGSVFGYLIGDLTLSLIKKRQKPPESGE